MIYIYTENFCLWPRLKTQIKRLLGRRVRGPQAVEDSLLRGLKELGLEFRLNRKLGPSPAVACVLTGAGTLRWVIKQKRRGRVAKILAGPVISVTPLEAGGLITSPEVDAFVVPSYWVKNWWGSLVPGFYDRIKLWQAGVEDVGRQTSASDAAVVLQKNAPSGLFEAVCDELSQRGIPFKSIHYGHFAQNDYFEFLERAKFLIYLSQSESQGLALQEAWIRNVPTLVWNRGYLTYGNLRWDDPKIAAPLMTEDCGRVFKDGNDFSAALESFTADLANFHPRRYALANFTDQVCAAKYVEIIHGLKNET